MKVIRYENRKIDTTLYDISTPEKEAKAYLRLFKELNEDWDVYSELKETEVHLCEPCTDGYHKYCKGEDEDCMCDNEACLIQTARARQAARVNAVQKELYEKALTGDVASIKKLMRARKYYEYESVFEVDVIDPLEDDNG